jgi:hypothetical protein
LNSRKLPIFMMTGLVLLGAGCQQPTEADPAINQLSKPEREITRKLERDTPVAEQSLIMLMDIHVGKQGEVKDVRLSSAEQGKTLSPIVEHQVRTETFEVKTEQGVAVDYWLTDYPYEVLKAKPL